MTRDWTGELIGRAVGLADVLSRENAALSALDFGTAAALLAEKTAALEGFAAAELGPQGAGDPELARVAGQLRGLAAENRVLLERALMVQTRVIGTIARAAPRAVAGAPALYRADGGASTGRLPAVALSVGA